ncbi:TetR/AcrR family transcriptional regulator [Nocardia nepalensis]|uniref:TetR/AcrR family transcriptional regulator n=1 Tax=Nocardia nepalensis TaxID=3375448 RepID=UPI003B67EC9E
MKRNGSRADKDHNKDLRTRDRILRATLEWAADTGVGKLSMDEIAHRARLARATLYLHFPGRQALISAAVRWELERFFADISHVVARYDDVEERLVHGFAYGYRTLRSHRTLNAVLELNPQILLPYVLGDASAIDRARRAVMTFFTPSELPPGVDSEVLAEQIVRTYHTLILAPSKVFDLDSIGGPEQYARTFLVPLIRPRHEGDPDYLAIPPEPQTLTNTAEFLRGTRDASSEDQ